MIMTIQESGQMYRPLVTLRFEHGWKINNPEASGEARADRVVGAAGGCGKKDYTHFKGSEKTENSRNMWNLDLENPC